MSRSNPSEHAVNPVSRWFEWDSQRGEIRYYDKSTKQSVSVGLGVTFLLLDQLARVGGFHEPTNGGIFSNEVRNIGEDAITVRVKGGVLAQGKYSEIKEAIKLLGGRFVSSLYVAYRIGDGALQLGNLQLKGAALKAWMDFSKEHKAALYGGALSISGSVDGKKGSVKFKSPIFAAAAATPEDNAVAVALDKELQAFLSVSLKAKAQPVDGDDVPAHTDSDAPEFDGEEAPF